MGADAGYTVKMTVKIDPKSIKITKIERGENAYFEADIIPSFTDWNAQSYYEGVSSEGVYSSDGILSEVFDDNDRQIQGGKLYGVYPLWMYEEQTEKEILEAIKYYSPDEFEVEAIYGRGWIHQNLPETFTLREEQSYICETSYMFVDKVEINAPAIANAINEFFAHSHEVDEYYFSEE